MPQSQEVLNYFKLLIAVPPVLKEQLDYIAKRDGSSRSEIVRRLLHAGIREDQLYYIRMAEATKQATIAGSIASAHENLTESLNAPTVRT